MYKHYLNAINSGCSEILDWGWGGGMGKAGGEIVVIPFFLTNIAPFISIT